MTASTPILVGSSEAFQAFHEKLSKAARSDATVLFTGESGTGKGLAARTLHEASPRSAGPFVVVSLAGLSANLVEATLFGHEKGAFTDAHRSRAGLFRRAEGGTLALDDVDLLPLEVQVKLLRVLQERVVEPLGAERAVPIDVRVVATTNRDLEREVEAGRFREDLFYRLAVVPLFVPPLRARVPDIAPLAEALLERTSRRLDLVPRALSAAARELLEEHAWPGNVRELENALERVLVLGGMPAGEAPGELPTIEPEEFGFLGEARAGVAEELAAKALSHGFTVETITRAMLERALEEQRGNVSAAARQVGLTRRAFDYRMGRSQEEPREA